MRIAAVLLAALALAVAAPALAVGAGPPPERVHAAPAAHTDEDTLPPWLLPAGAVAAVLVAALAMRRL
jgi:hypothetical protein